MPWIIQMYVFRASSGVANYWIKPIILYTLPQTCTSWVGVRRASFYVVRPVWGLAPLLGWNAHGVCRFSSWCLGAPSWPSLGARLCLCSRSHVQLPTYQLHSMPFVRPHVEEGWGGGEWGVFFIPGVFIHQPTQGQTTALVKYPAHLCQLLGLHTEADRKMRPCKISPRKKSTP